jgi:hypothetical protein
VGKPEGKRPLGIPRIRWQDIINMDLQEMRWGHELNRSGSGYGRVVGSCETSVSIKCGEFLDKLRTSYLFKKDSAPWSQLELQDLCSLLIFYG